MHVKDIMKEGAVVIDKDQNIQDALKLLKKHRISRLPVVNTNTEHVKELVGMVTEKDIATSLGSSKYGNMAPSHFHVSTVMTPAPITVESTRSIGNAAKTMIENKIGGMPVVDDGEIIGMLTKTDFIEICQGKPFNNTLVEGKMKQDLVTISPTDRLVHARRCIIDKEIGRLPVVEENELVGIITAKDIAKAVTSFRKVVPDKYKPARIRNLLVEDVMTQNVKTIAQDETVDDLSKLMLQENFSGVPVRGPENQLAGIITKTDLLEFIVELEEVH
ncbi:CBS domain-containing protein [Methanobacterium congolense]|uniref:CBS domain-containing protein n=1 Tax=Methanobacterium congolense TaxID=118062 RepID=A0A1D3L4S1_9EURY|nr:CBS domain-containing protein [Methanobacterium congolense]SCG86617.1 putative protein MJ1225 [Methanobacterium congolense]